MYHIAHDKRAIRSAEKIGEGLMKCLQTKYFTEITVTDIQKVTGVGRATFYRLFDNTADVLYWKCDTCFRKALCDCTPDMFLNEVDFAKHYFKYWMEHSDILECLIKINRQDIIYSCHMKNADILQSKYGNLSGLGIKHGEYFMSIRTGFTISILTVWVKNGRKETPEEIADIIKEQISIIANNSFHKIQ
ncbi:MAG: TetR/AcrR family transcriptional regulator [Christensenellales bacterium]